MTTHTFILRAVALVAVLAAWTLALGASMAHAGPIKGARCHKQGHVVALSEAEAAPDVRYTLSKGSLAILRHPLRYSDVQAYTRSGRGLQEYGCSARGGVDQWVSWRDARGRTFARFDGVAIYGVRRAVFAAWKE